MLPSPRRKTTLPRSPAQPLEQRIVLEKSSPSPTLTPFAQHPITELLLALERRRLLTPSARAHLERLARYRVPLLDPLTLIRAELHPPESTLAEVLCETLGLEEAQLGGQRPDPELVMAHFDPQERYLVFAQQGGRLLVALSNPFDPEVQAALEHLGEHTRFFATPESLRSTFDGARAALETQRKLRSERERGADPALTGITDRNRMMMGLLEGRVLISSEGLFKAAEGALSCPLEHSLVVRGLYAPRALYRTLAALCGVEYLTHHSPNLRVSNRNRAECAALGAVFSEDGSHLFFTDVLTLWAFGPLEQTRPILVSHAQLENLSARLPGVIGVAHPTPMVAWTAVLKETFWSALLGSEGVAEALKGGEVGPRFAQAAWAILERGWGSEERESPLEGGMLENGKITCEAHGAEFDLETGAATLPAVKAVRLYETVLEGFDLYIEEL